MASFFYRCPAKSERRKADTLKQIDALKQDKLLGLGDAKTVRHLVRLMDSLEESAAGDDAPDCAVKCRWLRPPTEAEPLGVIETLEKVDGLFAVAGDSTGVITPWTLPDGKTENDPKAFDAVPDAVLASWAARGNHSQGVIPVDKCQELLKAIAELPEGHEDGDTLKAELAAKPLGLLLSEKPAVLLAAARVKGDCLPEKFRPAVLQAYAVNPLADELSMKRREAVS